MRRHAVALLHFFEERPLLGKDLAAAQNPGLRGDSIQVFFHGELEFRLVFLKLDDLGKIVNLGEG